MNPGFVADASVGLSWAVASQSSELTDRLLQEVASGEPFIVPLHWFLEVASSLVSLTRRKRITSEQCARARRALGALTPLVDEEGPRLALGRIAELAEQRRLSVYDAAYLELAVRRGLPLASRDGALNLAAGAVGVRTLL